MRAASPVKLIIFDLDGTITEPFLDFGAIRREIGLEENAGPILEEMLKMPPSQRRRAEKILARHEQQAVEHSTLNAGARETLDAIRSAGIGIGILTRNTKSNVLAIAQRHGLKFDLIFDRDDGPAKPDAFGVLELCRRFCVKPQQTMVVGDYLFDILCAKAAGASAVLLANHENADQFAPHADYTIEKLEQILDIIAQKTTPNEG